MFFADWRAVLSDIIPQYFDFNDLRPYGATDCEFYDPVHGGEVAYMRIIRNIASKKESPLAGRVDIALLDQLIELNKGATTIAHNPLGQAYRSVMRLERDFSKPCVEQFSR